MDRIIAKCEDGGSCQETAHLVGGQIRTLPLSESLLFSDDFRHNLSHWLFEGDGQTIHDNTDEKLLGPALTGGHLGFRTLHEPKTILYSNFKIFQLH